MHASKTRNRRHNVGSRGRFTDRGSPFSGPVDPRQPRRPPSLATCVSTASCERRRPQNFVTERFREWQRFLLLPAAWLMRLSAKVSKPPAHASTPRGSHLKHPSSRTGCMLVVGLTSTLAGIFNQQGLFNVPLSPHLVRDWQFWRLLSSQSAFAHSAELLFGMLLLFNCGVTLEKFFGSVKFGVGRLVGVHSTRAVVHVQP